MIRIYLARDSYHTLPTILHCRRDKNVKIYYLAKITLESDLVDINLVNQVATDVYDTWGLLLLT